MSERRHKSRYAVLMLVLAVALFLAAFWGLFSGSVFISPLKVFEAFMSLRDGGSGKTTAALILQIRLPRLFLAALVGASLACSGACFQGLFRNSLADPYVIGASSGAALGAALAFGFGGSMFSFSLLSLRLTAGPGICAFAGSITAVLLAFVISRTRGGDSPGTLILAGASINAFCSALLALVLVIKDRSLVQVYYWLMGSLSGSTWSRLLSALPFMILGSVIIFISARPLDLLLQGEEAAESLGLDARKTRFILAVAATLPVAAAVSVSGVIGFVGLIAPHGIRFFTGPAHRRLLPASAMAGALLTLVADNLSRSIIPPLELPLGVITSLGGAPFFIFLLVRMKDRGGFN